MSAPSWRPTVTPTADTALSITDTHTAHCANLSVSVCRFAVQDKTVTVRQYRHTAECLSDCDAVQCVTRDEARSGAYCFLRHQGRTVAFPEIGASSFLGNITKCHTTPHNTCYLQATKWSQLSLWNFFSQLLKHLHTSISAHCTSACAWRH